MAARVEWANSAREDLDDADRYISRDSTHYADIVVERIVRATRHLEQFPLMGRVVPQDDSQRTRELVVEGYHVMYEVQQDVVWILRVLHGSRDLNNPANQPWEPH